MNRLQLVFDGIAWPAAKASDRRDRFEFPEDSSAVWGTRNLTYAVISTTGKGRHWSTTKALGWWRSFVELNLEDDEAIAGFVRRYGDPASELSPSTPVYTRHWLTLKTILKPIAGAWVDPDAISDARAWEALNGISQVTEDSEDLEHALLSVELHAKFMQQQNIEKILDRNGFGFRYHKLADFMIASAADMLFRRAKMRRCEVCGHWFELRRETARICSAACHVRKSTEGKRDGISQTDQVTPNGTVFWRAIWSIQINNKRRQVSKSFQKKADAKQHAAMMEDQAERRGIADPNRYTTRSYFEHWLANHPKLGKLSPTTVIGYRRNLEFLSRHVGDIPLSRLAALDLDRAYGALLDRGGRTRDGSGTVRPMAARTVLHVHRAAFTALRQAVKWSLLPRNPAENATAPTPRKSKARALNNAEWQRVWAAAQKARYPGMDALVATLAATGIRRSELLGLCWDAVDLDAGTIAIRRTIVPDADGMAIVRDETKTEGSRRPITVPTALVDLLKRHKAFIAAQAMAFGQDYCRTPMFCFPEAGGIVMKPDALTTKLRSLMRTAGVKGAQPVHAYRHSMATNALAAGLDVKTVSARMGHSRTSTTVDLYIHTDDDRDRGAADMMGKILGL